jgi:hypothetical protein
MLELHTAGKSPPCMLQVLCQLGYSPAHVADNGSFFCECCGLINLHFEYCGLPHVVGLFVVSLYHCPDDSLPRVLLGLHYCTVQEYWSTVRHHIVMGVSYTDFVSFKP